MKIRTFRRVLYAGTKRNADIREEELEMIKVVPTTDIGHKRGIMAEQMFLKITETLVEKGCPLKVWPSEEEDDLQGIDFFVRIKGQEGELRSICFEGDIYTVRCGLYPIQIKASKATFHYLRSKKGKYSERGIIVCICAPSTPDEMLSGMGRRFLGFLSDLSSSEQASSIFQRDGFPVFLHLNAGNNMDRIYITELQKKFIKDQLRGKLAWALGPRLDRITDLVNEARIEGRISTLEEALLMARKVGGPDPILLGRHLINELGWAPSSLFSKVLAAVEEAQFEGQVTTLDEALAMARKLGEVK